MNVGLLFVLDYRTMISPVHSAREDGEKVFRRADIINKKYVAEDN